MKMTYSNNNSGRLKKWLKYLVHLLIIFAYISFYAAIWTQAKTQAGLTVDTCMTISIMMSGNIVFGLLVGFEHLLNERRREGRWVFNLPRIILIGIPSLIFGMYYFIYYSNNSVLIAVTNYLPHFMVTSNIFVSLCQILLGYVLITNFSKQK